MRNFSSPNALEKTSSLSGRFSYALIGVVTLILIAFAAGGIVYNITTMNREIEGRLNNAMQLALISLPTPLWNLDSDIVDDLADALFLDKAIIYIKVSSRKQIISEKRRDWLRPELVEAVSTGNALNDSDLIFKNADIHYDGSKVGRILITISRADLKKRVRFHIIGITALILSIITAIWLTSIAITKRYISRPLSALQASAASISRGDLDVALDKSSRDEIGSLARHLDAMRRSIKQLFEEVNASKDKIEEYSRTLEQKVEDRTRALARSVEELTALGEISRTVSSTLDLETVLSRIVRHAVQLSEADAGTIYEFDEVEEVFVPRINHGTSDRFVRTILESKFRLGEGTVIGQAAVRREPAQIPDLDQVPRYPHSFLQQEGFKAILAIPLLRKDQLIGGLIIRRKTAGEFPVALIDLLQNFASQSALTMHNALLFQEIKRKGRELAIANRHKSMFLANMSHELRTPLNAILGYTELILDNIYGQVPDKIKEVLERLGENGRHLLGLINDVLDLSKIEAGQLTLALNDYSMAETIHMVVSSLEALISEKKLDLHVAVAPDLPPGKGDNQRIAQVLLNLIGNAIKFTENGEIRVRATAVKGAFWVSVSDTGPGLSASDQVKIFKEFHQVDGSSTRQKGGTGLGLSIAQRIVGLHGGRIWVESELGKGSTFHFKLPIIIEKQDAL